MGAFHHIVAAAALAVAPLAWCEAQEPDAGERFKVGSVSGAAGDAMRQTREGLGEAALSPLEDLNVRKDPVPPLLASIKDPFSPVEDPSCPRLQAELIALSSVLGPEPGAPKEDRTLSGRVAEEAASEALKTVASQAREFIPYRNLVRKATGADRHQKAVRRAFERGAQRRAYLKGIGAAMACDGGGPAMPAEGAAFAAGASPVRAEKPAPFLDPIAAADEIPAYVPAPSLPAAKPRADRTLSPPSAYRAPPPAPETAPQQWPPEG